MNSFFGIPIGPLAIGLTIALAVVLAVLGAFALRNRVFFRLGVRNVRRRRSRTALVVAGLMLGTTIITAALASGDTMTYTVRSSAVKTMGATDELIAAKGANADIATPGDATGTAYFPEQIVPQLARNLRQTRFVDGVAPAIIESIAVQDTTTRQSKSRVTLFASTAAGLKGFSAMRSTDGTVLSLASLGPGEIYLNADAADDLNAKAGDRLQLFAGERRSGARVRAIVSFDGAGTDGPAALTGLRAAQDFLGQSHLVKYVLVSNNGDAFAGAKLTDEVTRAMSANVNLLRLELDPVKRDALDNADAEGTAFLSMFTTFGSFSIAAGVMLIFLIFVMLAAERRGELGIARALGTRRGHLVQMFIFEGVVYDLAAAAVGAAVGVAVAFGMVLIMSSAMGTLGVEIHHNVRLRSILVAYALGVLLTALVVTVSAWRVSRLNIVSAIRNTPEPGHKGRKRRWLLGIVTIVLGALLLVSGLSASTALPVFLGASLIVLGLVPVLRLVGVSERLAYTAAGTGIVVLWLAPATWVEGLVGKDLTMGFEMWIAGGLLVVLGASWMIINNADLLLAFLSYVTRGIRSLTPVLRMAIAYPLRSRFRTGVTLVMFTLVVFTLVVGSTTSGSFISSFDNVGRFGGGWDVRASSASVAPLGDLDAAIARAPGLQRSDFRTMSSMALMPVDARQAGAHPGTYESYVVRGLDQTYLHTTTFGFAATAHGFTNPWQTMAKHPAAGYAVLDSIVVPRKNNWSAGAVLPDFKVTGFYIEDGTFEPFPLLIRDAQTGKVVRLTIIGVLKDFASTEMFGISTTQPVLSAAFGGRATPTQYYFKLAPGVDARATANRLEAAFLQNGVEANALQKLLRDVIAANWTFNRLIQGFMALGLLVGIAALGVISARAVVERRQQIGILRAIGFQRRAIQLTFILESSFIALTAIVVGTVLGLVIARNVVADAGSSSVYSGVHLVIPWLNLTLVFVSVYAVALLTTLAPALRASRVYPAQALRYE
jgi:putative ABC transport system permease protein